MKLLPLSAFSDNYIWMLHDGRQALVVDPGESQPVCDALAREGLALSAILVTHHHGDHTGGVDALRQATGAIVHGPQRDPVQGPLQMYRDGDRIHWQGLTIEVIDVPGHTAGHIAFFVELPQAAPIVFCGDTLFSAGCGRLFEGTPQQMHASLQRLSSLPDHTQVCCAHEYTLGNLKFACEVESDNQALTEYLAHCKALRAQGLPTLPSTIGREKAINPFLRTSVRSVIEAACGHDAAHVAQHGVFATLREWKNQYR